MHVNKHPVPITRTKKPLGTSKAQCAVIKFRCDFFVDLFDVLVHVLVHVFVRVLVHVLVYVLLQIFVEVGVIRAVNRTSI
jgi:hypothetical protein